MNKKLDLVIVTQKNAYIGMKVVRGKDWTWGSQDSFYGEELNYLELIKKNYGIITKIENGWVKVLWKNKSENTYRILNFFDLFTFKEPLQETLQLEFNFCF